MSTGANPVGIDSVDAVERRRRRREFVRDHHPDRGGDADRFVTGLAALEALAPIGTSSRPRVVVVRRPGALERVRLATRRLWAGRTSQNPSRGKTLL